MYKIIALIGEAGAGKDHILQLVLEEMNSLHEIVSCTTRPPREGEVDGVNYHFLTGEQFGQKVLNGEMLEASCFNDWFYGTSFESLRSDCVNIGVFNPEGIDSMIAIGRGQIDLYVYRIEASDKTRLIRQLTRESNPDVDEIIRRYSADKIDFSDLDFDYNYLTNETLFQAEQAVDIIVAAARTLEAKNE